MGLEIKDLTAASPNIVSFGIKIGSSVVTPLGFSTLPPHLLTPIIITLETQLICTAKTTVAPFEYSFITSTKYIENNNNQATQRVFNKSVHITGLTYIDATPSSIDYRYNITGSNGFTTYERGVYRLYQTI